MMFNSFFKFSQNKLAYLYNNSTILANIDWIILPLIFAVFICSMFLPSETLGVLAFGVIFFTFIKFLVKPNERIEFQNFEVWLIAYFMIVLISLFGSTLFGLSLKGFFKTFIYIGFYFSVVQYLKAHKNHIACFLGLIALCVSTEFVIGFMQSFLHLDAISTWQDTSRLNPEDVLSRVYGSLKPYNPNLFGGYLVSAFPTVLGALFYFINKRYYKLAVLAGGVSLLGVYTIFQTGCRGAYLALMLIFACVFVLSAKFFWQMYKKLYITVITTMLSLFIAAITLVNSIRLRFLSIFAMRNDSSNSFRFNVYHSAIEMFKDNWILGIGVGNKNFREIYGLYMKTGFDALSAYNIYLEIAVESGIFALIAFLGFLISLIKKSVEFIKKSTDIEGVICVSVSLVAILGVLFHGIVDTIFFRPQIQFVFWTYVAVISVFVSKNKQNNIV
ncbi:MAG: hypothetical protein E7Z87_05600 [Cyanobacteria bacterium SIG26]|nr:hypothetical protein [Cyanobacteria bacterium SIG26]